MQDISLSASSQPSQALPPPKPYAALSFLSGHGGDVYVGRWSPNGQLLATACSDGIARLWRPSDPLDPSLEPLACLSHQDDVVSKLDAESPDSREVVTLDWHVRL